MAEFVYRPVACDRGYRVIVGWKSLAIHQGQQRLFDDAKAFFYIANDHKTSASGIVTEHANQRCNQGFNDRHEIKRTSQHERETVAYGVPNVSPNDDQHPCSNYQERATIDLPVDGMEQLVGHVL